MTFKEAMQLDNEALEMQKDIMAARENLRAVMAISIVQQYGHKRVRVIKGRKAPIGTEGEVFWLGSYCSSPHGDPWGIYTKYKCGIRDDSGKVWWTYIDNVEVIDK